jgi:hypothetical protein
MLGTKRNAARGAAFFYAPEKSGAYAAITIDQLILHEWII